MILPNRLTKMSLQKARLVLQHNMAVDVIMQWEVSPTKLKLTRIHLKFWMVNCTCFTMHISIIHKNPRTKTKQIRRRMLILIGKNT